jgi:uncharacterized repeat protein (TIGR01451 family)
MHRVLFLLLFLLPAALAAPDGTIREVSLAAKDLVWDRASGRIYATVGPGSVVPVEPATGAVGRAIEVGKDAGKLALTDDGRYLYVALGGETAVRRVDLRTGQAGLRINLGGELYAEDIEAVPGMPEAVVVSRKRPRLSPRHEGVVLFYNGILRQGHGRVAGSTVLAVSDSAARLYGYTGETTEFAFRRMAVDRRGVMDLSSLPELISGFNPDLKCEGGRVFVSHGPVVDPEAGKGIGHLPGGSMAPDARAGRVFVLRQEENRWRILAFDWTTLQQVGALEVPGVSGGASSLIRWGEDGLAFRTGGGQVFLIRSSLVPPAPRVDLSVTQKASADPVAAGASLTYTVTVTNRGPDVATGVRLIDTLPAGAVLQSTSVSQGEAGHAAGTIIARIGTLPRGGKATLEIALVTGSAGTLANEVRVTGSGADPDPADNRNAVETEVNRETGLDLAGVWREEPRLICRSEADCVLQGRLVVRNAGRERVGKTSVRFYLSPGEKRDENALLLEEAPVAELSRGKGEGIQLRLKIPPSFPAEGKYLFAVLDAGDALAEVDEGNNTLTAGPFSAEAEDLPGTSGPERKRK